MAARRVGATVEIVVEDQGPPVPPERLARAGQPFYSAWPGRKGAGLGIYVARTFARAAGGELTLQACELRGVRATLTMALEQT